MLQPQQLFRAYTGGDVPGGAAVALEPLFPVEHRLPGGADIAQLASRIEALKHKIGKRLFRLEPRLVLVPAAVVASRNRAVVPSSGAEILLRCHARLFHTGPDDQGETAVLVLFPIPVGREFKQALQALLALPQRPARIFRALCFATLA